MRFLKLVIIHLIPKIEKTLNGDIIEIKSINNYLYLINVFDQMNITNEEMVAAIDKLPENYKLILKKFYGDDYLQRLVYDNENVNAYNNLVRIVIPKLKKIIAGQDVVFRKDSKYAYLFNIFGDSEETKEIVLAAILKLPEKYQTLLKKMYGENYDQKMIYERNIYSSFKQTVLPKLQSLVSGEEVIFGKENKYSYFYEIFGKKEEVKEVVDKAVESLPEKYQTILKELYGENYEQKMTYIYNSYIVFLQTILPKLTKIINGEEVTFGKESKYGYFYRIFGKKEEVKEVVDKAVEKLPEKYQMVLKELYGDNLEQKLPPTSEIKNSYHTFTHNVLPKLTKIINGEEVSYRKENSFSYFYEIFGKKEEVKEVVDKAVEKLPEKYQTIIKKLYGENFEQKLPPLGEVRKDYQAFTRSILPKVKQIIMGENATYGKESKYSCFYEIFGKKEDVKEVVDKAVEKLPEKYQTIIKKLYGENFEQKMPSYNEIKKEYANFIGTILPKLQSLINGEVVTFGNESKYKYFYKIFGEDESTIVKLKEVVGNLNEQHQQILKNTYGNDLNNEANFNNISKTDYSTLAYTIVPKIKEGLMGKDITINETKYTYFFKVFEENNTKERVIEVVGSLSQKHQDILYRLYGEDLNSPICRDKITNAEYSNFIHIIINKIKNELEGKTNTYHSRYTNFYSIFGAENNQELLKRCVLELDQIYQETLARLYGNNFDKEMNYNKKDYDCLKNTIIPKLTKLITNSVTSNSLTSTDDQFKQNLLNIYYNPLFVQLSKMLPEKDCLIWVYYWGYNSGKRYTIEELVNLLNVTDDEVLNSLKKSATLISNTLEYVNKVLHMDELAKLIRLKD